MFKYLLLSYFKYRKPLNYCLFDGCLNKAGTYAMCAECYVEIATEDLVYEIYEYLGGGNYGIN